MTSHFGTLQPCRTFKMTNKRCVTEKVKMCICTICFCMCVVYFVYWYVKHRLKKKKKKKKIRPYYPIFFYVTPIKQFFLRPKLCINCFSNLNVPMSINTVNLITVYDGKKGKRSIPSDFHITVQWSPIKPVWCRWSKPHVHTGSMGIPPSQPLTTMNNESLKRDYCNTPKVIRRTDFVTSAVLVNIVMLMHTSSRQSKGSWLNMVTPRPKWPCSFDAAFERDREGRFPLDMMQTYIVHPC